MSMRWISKAYPVALALAFAACSGATQSTDAGTGSDAGATGSQDAATGDSSTLVGTFQVRLVPPENGGTGYTSVAGKVFDGPTPSLLVWKQAVKDGDCALLTPKVPFCSQSCGGGAVCVDDEKCQAYPTARSAGTVTVTGLRTASGATQFTMNPIANSYQPSETLPYPAFSEGDEVRFEASGGSGPAFTVKSRGIKALELTNSTLTVAKDQPLTLTWTTGSAGISRIHVKLDISHHGGIKGMITCDAADTGSLVLSAPLVTELLNLGVAGFPSISVARSAVGSAVVAPGTVELQVTSDVERQVQVPGVSSCNEDSDCPDGGTCKTDLTCT